MPLHVEFGVRVGVKDVAIEGAAIRGTFAKESKVLSKDRETRLLLQNFANVPTDGLLRALKKDGPIKEEDARAIANFTKNYGPIDSGFEALERFYVETSNWLLRQMSFRWVWEKLGRTAAKKHWPADVPVESEPDETPIAAMKKKPSTFWTMLRQQSRWDQETRPDDSWGDFFPTGHTLLVEPGEGEIDGFGRAPGARGGLRAGVNTLHDFLVLALTAMDGRYLRKCWREDCKQRYFIADDLKAHYCSHGCSQWSRSEHKNRWWREHGKEWRKDRKKEAGR